MRTYVVRPGDSPASIAAQAGHAGCPKCSRDLVLANHHKKKVFWPNGYVTFESLEPGEVLELPEKWFDGELDRLPPSYFASLPSADGVTPPASGLGQAVPDAQPYHMAQSVVDVLGSAQAAQAAIVADPNYCANVSQPGSAVNTAVHEFKVAWNAANASSPVPLGTGQFEPATAAALATVVGSGAPTACPAPALQPPLPTPSPAPAPAPLVTAPRRRRPLSTGAVVGLGLFAAVAVGGVTYAALREPVRLRRRRRQ